jgi:NADH dehydrogenase/NADH:ubiquinone oxidoreductase subunit G
MQQQVTLTIDGATVRAARGTSVLDAALAYGICIPHLCHVPGLKDTGACRLCIVENVQNGRSRVTTSCTLTVQEGMVIRTNTENIKRLRRNIAELIVAEAPNSRAVQDIAVRCGVREVRYPFRRENCIQCGRCVRYCTEMWRANALGFVGRGVNRKVDFAFGNRRDICKKCQSCVIYCPMSVTPCGGPMKPGEERLCGKCESVELMTENAYGACVHCELGKGFQCTRHAM